MRVSGGHRVALPVACGHRQGLMESEPHVSINLKKRK